MSEEKAGSYKGLTEARKRANKKYNDRFVEIKVRVTPEKRSVIKEHAESMGEVQLPLSIEPSMKPWSEI